MMRLLIAMMKHETNTFSRVPTPLTRFGSAPYLDLAGAESDPKLERSATKNLRERE
jgi:microcystin degradation protein MlrC